jgi:hypothetical protein
MNPLKRTRNPAESERSSKMTRISRQSDNAVAAGPLAQQRIDEVQVTVKLRSASKAVQNDPKPPDYWEKLRVPELSGRDPGDGPPTSSDDSRTTSRPSQPPTPMRPKFSTAPGSPKSSVSEDHSHTHRDMSIARCAEESNSGHSM